jgi:hypothetical protein
LIGTGLNKTVFSKTIDYDKLTLTSAPDMDAGFSQDTFGLLVATDSDTFVYGVKSDVGTTDGFLVLPLTTASNEFFVAGWQ